PPPPPPPPPPSSRRRLVGGYLMPTDGLAVLAPYLALIGSTFAVVLAVTAIRRRRKASRRIP
ncbi:MAG: hypothetical protein QW645_05585, partial [Candidatus Bathyarchaeia archaeon]